MGGGGLRDGGLIQRIWYACTYLVYSSGINCCVNIVSIALNVLFFSRFR